MCLTIMVSVKKGQKFKIIQNKIFPKSQRSEFYSYIEINANIFDKYSEWDIPLNNKYLNSMFPFYIS